MSGRSSSLIPVLPGNVSRTVSFECSSIPDPRSCRDDLTVSPTQEDAEMPVAASEAGRPGSGFSPANGDGRLVRRLRPAVRLRKRRPGSGPYSWSSMQRAASFQTLFRSFANDTTAHGIRQLAAADSCLRRLLWASVLALVTMGWVTHLANEIHYYFSYPVNVQTSFLMGAFSFPDVIICDPIGPIRPDLILRAFNGTGHHDLLQSSDGVAILPQMFWGELQHTDKSRFFLSHFIDLPSSALRPEDYIIFCRYQKQPCNFLNFSVYYHHDFMNCFAFQPPTRKMSAAGTDNGLTLVLNVPQRRFVESFSGFGEKYEEALLPLGLRVSLQQQGTIPHPSEGGWVLPKGMLTEINLWHFRSSLINTPVAPCSDGDKIPHFNHATGHLDEYNYRTEDCLYHQILRRTEEICNCSVHVDDHWRNGFDWPRRPNCHSSFNITRHQLDFVMQLRRKPHDHHDGRAAAEALRVLDSVAAPVTRIIDCFQQARQEGPPPDVLAACPNPCNYENYVTAISQAMWPQAEMLDRIKEMLLDTISREYFEPLESLGRLSSLIRPLGEDFAELFGQLRACNRSACSARLHSQLYSFMERNFLELRVFPRSLDIQFTEEKTSLPLSSLMSQLGGLSGLWLGISIVTLCEFVEFSAALLRRACRPMPP